MKKTALIAAGMFCLSIGAYAATHSAWSAPIAWDGPTAIEGTSLAAPTAVTGFSVVPNPAVSSKSVCFQLQGKLEGKTDGSLKIYDVNGKQLQVFSLAGRHAASSVTWIPQDKNGKPLPSGIYLARLKAGSVSFEQKFMLLK
jgi:hypothetical protein